MWEDASVKSQFIEEGAEPAFPTEFWGRSRCLQDANEPGGLEGRPNPGPRPAHPKPTVKDNQRGPQMPTPEKFCWKMTNSRYLLMLIPNKRVPWRGLGKACVCFAKLMCRGSLPRLCFLELSCMTAPCSLKCVNG